MSEGLAESLGILNPAVFQILQIGYFSMIEGCGTDFTAVYTVLRLEKMVSDVLEQLGCFNHVYIAIFIEGKQIQMKFPAEF